MFFFEPPSFHELITWIHAALRVVARGADAVRGPEDVVWHHHAGHRRVGNVQSAQVTEISHLEAKIEDIEKSVQVALQSLKKATTLCFLGPFVVSFWCFTQGHCGKASLQNMRKLLNGFIPSFFLPANKLNFTKQRSHWTATCLRRERRRRSGTSPLGRGSAPCQRAPGQILFFDNQKVEQMLMTGQRPMTFMSNYVKILLKSCFERNGSMEIRTCDSTFLFPPLSNLMMQLRKTQLLCFLFQIFPKFSKSEHKAHSSCLGNRLHHANDHNAHWSPPPREWSLRSSSCRASQGPQLPGCHVRIFGSWANWDRSLPWDVSHSNILRHLPPSWCHPKMPPAKSHSPEKHAAMAQNSLSTCLPICSTSKYLFPNGKPAT